MLKVLKRLLSPEYLVVAEPGPLGGLWVLFVLLGFVFACGAGIALWTLVSTPKPDPSSSTISTSARKTWAWFELWICLAGIITVAGRFLGWPGWSARIWPFSLAVLAIAGMVAYWLRRLELAPWLSSQFRVLAFSIPTSSLMPPPTQEKLLSKWSLVGLLVHIVGIGLVVSARYKWPVWTAPLILLSILAPQIPMIARRKSPCWMALTPLLGAYAATTLWLLYRSLDITIIGWQGLIFPNPMTSIFYVDGIILAAVVLAWLCQIYIVSASGIKQTSPWHWTAITILTVTLLWAGAVYFGKRTHGATASDPYAYAQMGADLAEHGTFLHRFSLFEQVMPLGIAWAPLQPVGYHIPINDLGDCPSVWATGASALLAIGYRLLGEVGLYVTTPLVALLALAATWGLVQETLRREPASVRGLTGALAVTLLATSPEYVDRLLVPMADAPAQLFTVLTLLFALRGMRKLENRQPCVPSFALAGISFAWAYWVRHTQLALALPITVAVLLGHNRAKTMPSSSSFIQRLLLPVSVPLLAFFGTAFVVALPDIVYRWQVFGGPLATETTELHLMRLEYVVPVAWQMLRDALAAGEWGYLFPLALYGGYQLARKRQPEMMVLGSAFASILLVHLTYHSLRLRDLISLFPLVDLAIAYGAANLVQHVRAVTRGRSVRLGSALLPVVVIAWVVLSLALSRWAMIDNLWKRGWASFGYMRAEHRAAFDRLAELTPPDSVIGASLNAGAVALYTGRDAIRPYDSWTVEEWDIFLEAMRARGRPIYLLDDGELIVQFIEREQRRQRLVPIEEMKVPLFNTKGRETGWLYHLEWER